jgi:putative acetyltransferase
MEIRPATTLDVPLIATISRLARELEMPYLPVLHTPDDDLAFFTAEISTSDCKVALVDGVVVGFGCVRAGWLNHLYVAPEFQGQGIGSALLGHFASAIEQFWVFQANTRARTFCKSHGFIEVEYTDGSANEEREPDVRFIAPI